MKQLSLVSILFCCTCNAYSSSAEVMKLTQEQAITRALQKNFNIRIKEIDPKILEQRIRQEKGAFDPSINASYVRSTDHSGGDDDKRETLIVSIEGKLPAGTLYSLGLNTSEGTGIESFDSEIHSAFAGVELTQPLLKGFGLDTNWTWVKIADRKHKIGQWNLKQTALDVVLQVIQTYNSFFLAQQNAEVAIRNRDLAEQLVADNRKRIAQGMVDIAVAEAELAVREERVLRTQGYLRIQENSLKNLIFNDYKSVISTDLSIDRLARAK